jgi:hypothetical protein
MTYRALGLGLARSTSAFVGAPVNTLSSRLQCVTQCISHTTSTAGISRISAYVSSYGCSHCPNTRSDQYPSFGSTLGTPP